jgi:hypothetical protein
VFSSLTPPHPFISAMASHESFHPLPSLPAPSHDPLPAAESYRNEEERRRGERKETYHLRRRLRQQPSWRGRLFLRGNRS